MYFATGASLTAAIAALPSTTKGNYKAFDDFYYAQLYMGSYSGSLSPIEHFVQIGAARGNKPNADFDPAFYKAQYADLKNTNFDAADLLFHYVNSGLNEGRIGNATLASSSWSGYLAAYPDVATYVNANLASFGGSTTNGAVAHYAKFGQYEGRAVPGGPSSGQTFTLTTSVDYSGTIKGDLGTTSTTGNDTFVGLVDYGAGPALTASTTLTAQDVIDGGALADKLNLTVTGAPGAGVTLPAATITGIETVNLRSVLGTTQIVTMAAPSGATTLNADRSTDAVVFTGLASGASLGNITGSAAVSGTYVAGVTAATLNAQSGVTAGLQTITGNADNLLTTLNINSTGAANTLGGVTFATGTGLKTINIAATTNLTTGTIAGMAAATTLNVSGAATTVNVGTLNANVTTVDASGLTAGGLTATLGVATGKVTGGAGNDNITTGTIVLGTGSVAAGAGTDRLIVTAAADVAATPAAKYTGFEIVRAGAFSLDASLFTGSTITGVEVSGAASAFTNMTAAQAANVNAIATATGGTFTLSNATGTADVLTVSLTPATGVAATTPIDFTTATIDGFETLNVVANSGISTAVTSAAAAGSDAIGFTSAANLTRLVVTGANNVGVSLANALKVTTLDLSGMTGTAGAGVTLAANTGALTVTGTANTDFITLATLGAGGTVTVNSGAGNDTITGTQAQVAAAAAINGGANASSTGDTLALSDTATTISDNTFANVSGIERVTLANTTALTWTIGGYANAIATTNGGVLDITAASIAAGGTIAVDASGLGATNSLKISMTNTNGGANAVNITGSNNGADSISYTAATAAGLVTISAAGTGGSTASKTVTLAGTVGTGAITTGAGADTITVGGTVTTVTAGAGADTITLAAADGKQQTLVVSAANATTTTAFDRVTNFSTVVTDGDVLDVATAAILTTAQLLTGQAGWAVSAGGTTVGVATKSGATLADFIAAFSASTTAGVVAFADGGNTYVGHSDGSASTTTSDQLVMLVGLTGVTGITLSATSVATNISVI